MTRGPLTRAKLFRTRGNQYMSKALRIEPDIGLREILEISAGNDFDVVFNPLLKGPGGNMGGTFVKPAPGHEGITKGDNESMDAYLDRLSEYGDVDQSVEAVQSFISSAQSSVGTPTGLALFQWGNGEYQPMPEYSARLAEYAGNGEVQETFPAGATGQLMDAYVQASGDRPQFPAVY